MSYTKIIFKNTLPDYKFKDVKVKCNLNLPLITKKDFRKLSIQLNHKNVSSLVYKPMSVDQKDNTYQNIRDYKYILSQYYYSDLFLQKFLFKPFVICIYNVFTEKFYRGEGLASKLFNEIINHYNKQAHFFLYADPFKDWEGNNKKVFDLMKFYAKFGFKHYPFLYKDNFMFRI
jgi:GNAT superfamily N-acetyltransferase